MPILSKKNMQTTLFLQGREIPCQVKTRSNAKTVRYRIGLDCVLQITVPPRLPMRQVKELISEREEWIVKSYDRQKSLVQAIQPKVDVTDGGSVPFLGGELNVSITREESQKITLMMEGETLFIRAGFAHTDYHIKSALALWYKAMARRELLKRTQEWATRIGVEFKKLFIKDQKTRWGSCSSQGNVNFNYHLVMAPGEVVDYVVIHELCHLIHPNHSQEYWTAVARYCPEYKKAKKWLKEEGPTLKFV